jgi:hypothetical protein
MRLMSSWVKCISAAATARMFAAFYRNSTHGLGSLPFETDIATSAVAISCPENEGSASNRKSKRLVNL